MPTPFGERLHHEDPFRSSRMRTEQAVHVHLTPHVVALNDSPDVLAFLHDLLADEGYRVSTRMIAAVDLMELGQLAPDVIVVEAMWLTGIDWSLLQRLASEPQTRAIPVVLCTIPKMRTSALQARLGGLTVRVVDKPYTLDDLLAAVGAALAEVA